MVTFSVVGTSSATPTLDHMGLTYWEECGRSKLTDPLQCSEIDMNNVLIIIVTSLLGIQPKAAGEAVLGLNIAILVLLAGSFIFLLKPNISFQYKREVTISLTAISAIFSVAAFATYYVKVINAFKSGTVASLESGNLYRFEIATFVGIVISLLCLVLHYYFLQKDSAAQTMNSMQPIYATSSPQQLQPQGHAATNHNVAIPTETLSAPLVQGQAHSDYVKM